MDHALSGVSSLAGPAADLDALGLFVYGMENHFTQPTFVFWCALCSRPTVAVIRVLNRLFTRT